MEQDALILRILEGKRVAKRCAGDILAWVADSQAFPFAALEEYIRNKFLLLPEDIRERNLLKLAKISVVRTSGLAKEHAWAADGKDCAGATSSLTKKVLLMMAIEKDMDITMSAEMSAEVETVEELAHQIACLLRGKRVSG